jgi:tRNA(fMet)-specific endonuclease VapC
MKQLKGSRIMTYLLDTNIVSLALRNDIRTKNKLEEIKTKKQKIAISCITYFEIKRGLIAVKATKQMKIFDLICQDYQIILLDDLAILEKASQIHADLRIRGLPIQTEDILIAATAIIKGFIVVSNDSDLSRINELKLENWLAN